MSLTLRHGACHYIIGSSQSGKSQYIYSFLRNLDNLYSPVIRFKSIYWCYGEQDAIKNIPSDIYGKLTLHEGIPDLSNLVLEKPAIIVFDDLYTQIFNRPEVVNFILNNVHHSDTSVLITTQVAFPREKYARSIATNSQYLVYLPSPRTNSQFGHLATQISEPGESKALIEAYRDSLQKKYTAFFCDLHPQSPNWCRFRTNIFPTDQCTIVYCPTRYSDECKADTQTTPLDGH